MAAIGDTPAAAAGCGMQTFRIRLTGINADGTTSGTDVIEVAAGDLREAMAAIVRRQNGWFAVEALGQSAPADVSLGSSAGADGRTGRTPDALA